jgi:hypothetical protein
LALIRSWRIGALSRIHLGGAFTGEVSRLSTSETTISRSASVGVAARVVVEVPSSGAWLHNLAIGVVVGGTIGRGWRALRLKRLPWWGLDAESCVAGSTLLLLLHLMLVGLIGCLALGFHHDGGIN